MLYELITHRPLEQLEQDDAEGVEVDAVVDALRLDHLRGGGGLPGSDGPRRSRSRPRPRVDSPAMKKVLVRILATIGGWVLMSLTVALAVSAFTRRHVAQGTVRNNFV